MLITNLPINFEYPAKKYMTSLPGSVFAKNNYDTHAMCVMVLHGYTFTPEELKEFERSLRYRLQMLYVATTYRNYLGVPFKSVRRFDAGAYADAVEKDEERRKRWEIIHKAVVKAGLFAGPAEDGGGQWSKRNEYISAMFMETEWDMEMISEVVGRLRTACRGS